MAINPIDLIVGSLILVLGLKGVFNGFRRELFGFVGLIGGVFIASRAADPLASLVERQLFQLSNPAALRLIAFILILLLIWGGVSYLGRFFEERSVSGIPSPLSRFAGFLVATTKYFLVFAMILTALYQTPLVRNSLQKHVKSSLLFPYLAPAGRVLIHLSPLGKPTIHTTPAPARKP
jgi:membrane protein required for colicin V production